MYELRQKLNLRLIPYNLMFVLACRISFIIIDIQTVFLRCLDYTEYAFIKYTNTVNNNKQYFSF